MEVDGIRDEDKDGYGDGDGDEGRADDEWRRTTSGEQVAEGELF